LGAEGVHGIRVHVYVGQQHAVDPQPFGVLPHRKPGPSPNLGPAAIGPDHQSRSQLGLSAIRADGNGRHRSGLYIPDDHAAANLGPRSDRKSKHLGLHLGVEEGQLASMVIGTRNEIAALSWLAPTRARPVPDLVPAGCKQRIGDP
jgi:hypothetical protein